MAREGQLPGRREDADGGPALVALWVRDHEGGLREAELERDALHRRGIKVARAGHHRQGVARVPLLGEYVDDVEAMRHDRGHPTPSAGCRKEER
jgi:hypothetical protein